MKTTEQITISIKIPLAETIRNLADAENRTISNMCARLLERAIKDGAP